MRDYSSMSENDPDIKGTVEQNRDTLKKLQMAVPGLRGYREREDMRVADEILRNQMADRLDRARENLELLRKRVALSGDYTDLVALGSLIAQIQALSGEVRHAAQGYSGFVAAVKVDETKLEALYNYDYSFVSAVLELQSSCEKLLQSYNPAVAGSLQAGLLSLSETVGDVKKKWSTRLEAIEGIAIGG
jgi:hypothetical protein